MHTEMHMHTHAHRCTCTHTDTHAYTQFWCALRCGWNMKVKEASQAWEGGMAVDRRCLGTRDDPSLAMGCSAWALWVAVLQEHNKDSLEGS